MLLAVAVCMCLSAELAYYRVFSMFRDYDDEGFMMVTQRAFNDGHLYGEMPLSYGPLPYLVRSVATQVLGMPLTHDANRMLSIVFWLAVALVCAVAVFSITKSILLTVAAYWYVFFRLTGIVNEPGHPQEVALLVTGIAVLAATFWKRPQRSVWPLVMGACVGGALLTKINVGAYLGLSLALAVSSCFRCRRLTGSVLVILLSIAVFLPFATMRGHMDDRWVFFYALTVGLSVVPLGASLIRHMPRGAFGWGTAAKAAGGGTIVAVTILVAVWAKGMSPMAVIRGPVAVVAGVSSWFHWYGTVPSHSAHALATSLALAAAWFGTRDRAGRLGVWLDGAAAAAKAGVSVTILLCVHVVWLGCMWSIFYVTPFLWVFMVPPEGSARWDFNAGFARGFLCLASLLSVLIAYPVAGSQIQWSIFLMVPLAAIGLADSGRVLGWVLPSGLAWFRHGWLRPLSALGVLAVALAIYLDGGWRTNARTRYVSLSPLNLPGSSRLRLPAEQAGEYQWLVQNLRAHADVFLTLPGLSSLYFWTGLKPPAQWSATTYSFRFWQRLVAASGAAGLPEETGRSCIVANGEIANMWSGKASTNGAALVGELSKIYPVLFHRGGYLLLAPAHRQQEHLHEYLLWGIHAFGGRTDDALSLPVGIISADRPFTVSGRFRSLSAGILAAAQSSPLLAPSAAAPRALLALYIGTDGRLRATPAAGAADMLASPTLVNDGRWHRVVWTASPEGGRLWLDGAPVSQLSVTRPPAAKSPDATEYVQLGAGCVADMPFAPSTSFPFCGELAEMIIDSRAWTAEDVAQCSGPHSGE